MGRPSRECTAPPEASRGGKGVRIVPKRPELDQVIYEFRRVGAYVKVSAVDPRTLTEVSITGSARAGEESLKRTARRKLEYVLGKRGGGAPPPEDQSGWNF
jgi:hypothetical protein